MQTFLPSPDYHQCAQILDYKRLGKQRVECKQILIALSRGSGGWYNHPAVQMWKGYEQALSAYANEMILEWIQRGYNNTMELYPVENGFLLPPWHGCEQLHSSHRAALLFKDTGYYSQFHWPEQPDLNYFWPSRSFTFS